MIKRTSSNTACSLLLLVCFVAAAYGQDGSNKTQDKTDDVISINTELVQTDVTVVDRQGRFVSGLPGEQFELRVNGKPQSVSFFEAVTPGAFNEGKQTGVASKDIPSKSAESRKTSTASPDGGRIIFFFVDDLHLTPASLMRARQALLKFVDDEVGRNDRVAIVGSSGRIGFLQQLTDNKAVLREAISRLDYKRNPDVDGGRVEISEYDASQVTVSRNRQLFRYLVSAMGAYSTAPAQTALNRVRQISAQSRFTTQNTLSTLEGLMLSSAPLPGRKLVFFLSDGFVTDARSSDVFDRLRRVTKTAARVGAVIYTMDTRGTFVNTYTDASQNPYPDYTGSVSRNVFAEGVATQEPLNILAEDTGGRAILNSNSFSEGFKQALNESSNYYLLAWRPESDAERSGKARIIVGIKGRPDLKVRLRRGVMELPVAASLQRGDATGKPATNSPDSELLATLGALYPVRDLPVSLSAGYMGLQNNSARMVVSMQIETAAFDSNVKGESRKAEIDVLGVALDDRGSISSFKQKLSLPTEVLSAKERRPFIWNQQLSLPPGLYQVRVAVRDRQTGRVGSAMQWIEIPAITQNSIAMSSIFIGELAVQDSAGKDSTAPKTVPIAVERRFAQSSRLRFQTYLYNAAYSKTDAPDVVLRVQLLQNDRPVLTLPQSKLMTNGATDFARLSYTGELALNQLPAGSYTLQISATDQKTKKSASQRLDFTVR